MSPAAGREIGLVDQLFPDGPSCLKAAMEYGGAIANGPSEAVGRAKVAACLGFGAPLDAGLALEREAMAHIFASGDAAEGIAAFVEKRLPMFQGR